MICAAIRTERVICPAIRTKIRLLTEFSRFKLFYYSGYPKISGHPALSLYGVTRCSSPQTASRFREWSRWAGRVKWTWGENSSSPCRRITSATNPGRTWNANPRPSPAGCRRQGDVRGLPARRRPGHQVGKFWEIEIAIPRSFP